MKRLKIFSQGQLPDIDKVLGDFIKRFLGRGGNSRTEDFSRDGGGSGDNGGGHSTIPVPPLRYLVVLVSAGIVVFWALAGFFTVDANERAVMFRLGNPTGIEKPGLVWHMPLIEDYKIVNLTEVRRVEVGFRNDAKRKDLRESLMLTGDLNIIDMQFVVQYALNDPEKFLFENRFSNARAEDVVKQVAETAMREVAGRSEIDFVLYEGRESVASETLETMQNILDHYKTGIDVREVAIQNVQPPDQVQGAFEDAIKARKDRDRKINEGKAYANDILPRSQGQAVRYLEDAEAYRQSKIAKAHGDVDRFLLVADEYVKASDITRRRLYLETMEEIFGRANKVMIDQDGAGNLLYLPLDKMMQAGGALRPEGAAGAGSNLPQGGLPSSLDGIKQRLRDGARSGLDTIQGKR